MWPDTVRIHGKALGRLQRSDCRRVSGTDPARPEGKYSASPADSSISASISSAIVSVKEPQVANLRH